MEYINQEQYSPKSSVHHIVSTVAYLLGVRRQIFENEYEPPGIEVFQNLSQVRDARIIRNLCMLRTAIERNFSQILYEFRYNMKNLNTLPQMVPVECLTELERDGISLYRVNHKIQMYLIDINGCIQKHIASCKRLFPVWLNWDYIKELFLMPGGCSETKLKLAANQYYRNLDNCPYQVYINWRWDGSELGNLLYNDEKFLTLLYKSHHDHFVDLSKVTDAGEQTKKDIYQFLASGERVIIVVDCENSDPYKLCAVLNNLKNQNLEQRVTKIILCDDEHTATAWEILDHFTDIPVEYELIKRVKAGKSLVDPKLVAKVCREVYRDDIDSVILFASDSDYWGMISEVAEANYLVMVERSKCSQNFENAMADAGIPYAYIDDFCTGSSYAMKASSVIVELRHRLSEFRIDIRGLLEDSARAARANMSASDLQQFYDRYVKPMKLTISKNGEISLELGS